MSLKSILSAAFLVILNSVSSFSQSLTSSNLPIVWIYPESTIQDEVRVYAVMKIINRGPGQTNYVTDKDSISYLDYDGRISIEIRGSSSQVTNKKQYAFTTLHPDNTTDNVKLLGMPRENDWILNGMVFDPAKIRDYLCYNLSRRIGQYASRTAYCEVIIGGVYQGIYMLQEKIKADDKRVDIVKIETTDNAYPDITGGYITKADKTTGGDPVAWNMYTWYNAPVDYIHVLPKPEHVIPQQNTYIHDEFRRLADRAVNNNASAADGFPSVIDVPSFIDYSIISELSSNADAYMYSTYFHKDRNGKLRAGPVWDGDLTFGNDLYFWGFDRSKTDIWQFSNYDNDGSRFWLDLFNNSVYRCYFSRRWNQLTRPGQPLNLTRLESFIDSTVSLISEAVYRDRFLWNATGSFNYQIEDIKAFISGRINWINANIGSYEQCADPPNPPLVISKIMYHPDTTEVLTQSDEQEFVEITNAGEEVLNLTGYYFKGTGFVFQFPAYTYLDPHKTFVIAANSEVFRAKYGTNPNGVFTRHLSNKEQDLILADAFGNTIDSVHYQDTIPWPEADGNGYYLQLASDELDNSLASSWIASNEDVAVPDKNIDAGHVRVFPNPAYNWIRIDAEFEISAIILTDMEGRILLSQNAATDMIELDMGNLKPGSYILQIITPGRIYTEKIIRL